MKKKSPILISLIFILFISLFAFANLILPDRSFSENENRELQMFPAFSIRSLVSGRFTGAVEEYCSDQFAFRDRWISLKARLELLQGKKENNGIFLCDGDRLLEPLVEPPEEELARKTGFINHFAAKTDTEVALALIPTASGVYPELLPSGADNVDQDALINHIYSLAEVKTADLLSALRAEKDEYVFYRTDHHWTSLGAYYGYRSLGETLGYTPRELEEFYPTVVSNSFWGTSYSFSGFFWLRQPDSISIYADEPPGLTVDRIDGSISVPGSLYVPEMLDTKDQYRFFLGGNCPRIVIRTGNRGLPSLLILRDSFADSLVPFLTEHYSSIHLLDLRYYRDSVARYVEENDIDSVLVLYSLSTFCTDQSLAMMTQ